MIPDRQVERERCCSYCEPKVRRAGRESVRVPVRRGHEVSNGSSRLVLPVGDCCREASRSRELWRARQTLRLKAHPGLQARPRRAVRADRFRRRPCAADSCRCLR